MSSSEHMLCQCQQIPAGIGRAPPRVDAGTAVARVLGDVEGRTDVGYSGL